jgi:tetratricopeptide (TPR) repeat protein
VEPPQRPNKTDPAENGKTAGPGAGHSFAKNPAPAIAVCLCLIVLVVFVFAQTRHFDFVKWDDPVYVSENSHVAQGLTWNGVLWAFTAQNAAYWLPMVWLSHMMDVQLFGMNAGLHHLTNVLFHTIDTLLLFLLLLRMTGALYRSAFVAALFAVHPMHVESVAWITERKDVLSTAFGLMAMWAYLNYVQRRRPAAFAAMTILYCCSLMAKPMLVTLPFLLLLLDVWPLGRISIAAGGRWERWSPLVREKVPLLALAILSSVITVMTVSEGGAVKELGSLPLSLRMANVSVSYAGYIRDMFWPVKLEAFYAYPEQVPLSRVALSLALIGVISAAVVAGCKTRPYIFTGWLWYLGALGPVVGFVQAGLQARADRFGYVPLIGLFILLAWGVGDLAAKFRLRAAVPGVAAGLAVLAYAFLAQKQAAAWENSVTLWSQAISVDPENYRAQGLLGIALQEKGDLENAAIHFRAALRYSETLRMKPDVAYLHYSLANILVEQGKPDQAAEEFSASIRANPAYAEAHNNLANLLAGQRKLNDAAAEYRTALKGKPGYADAHNGLGNVLADQGQEKQAVAEYEEALRIDPRSEAAHNNLGAVFAQQGNFDKAVQEFTESLRIRPDARVHYNIGQILLQQGKAGEALQHFHAAVQLRPDYQDAVRAAEALKGAGSRQ